MDNKTTQSNEISSSDLYIWLKHYPLVHSQLELIVISLRRRCQNIIFMIDLNKCLTLKISVIYNVRQIIGALPSAKATLEILRIMNVIHSLKCCIKLGQCKFTNTDHMMRTVRAVGRELTGAMPTELTIGNIVRRVLFLIREEFSNKLKSVASTGTSDEEIFRQRSTSNETADKLKQKTSITSNTTPNTTSTSPSTTTTKKNTVVVITPSPLPVTALLSTPPSLGSVLGSGSGAMESKTLAGDDFMLPVSDLRQALMTSINELNDELDNINQPICELAQEYIHADECILAYGYSMTAELFLKAAARKRRFQVIVAESGPSLEGHKLANALSKHPNISVSLISDSAIYALMSRVNKVIFSPNAIMADGGAICSSGHLMVALAAKDFAVPVVGVTGAFKLTPLYSHNHSEVLNHLLSPSDILPYESPVNFENISVVVPAFDYLPPDVINLYVTNSGSHQPSYMYRLLGEFYNVLDHDLDFRASS